MAETRRPRPISARPAHDAAVATEQAAAATVDDVGAGPGQAAAELTEVSATKTVGAVASAEDATRTAVVHQTAAEVRNAQNRLRVFIIAAAVVVLLLNLLVLLWFVNVRVDSAKEDVLASQAGDLRERDEKIAVLATGLDRANAQVAALGVQPVVPPAAALVQDVVGAQGVQGLQGIPGQTVIGPIGPVGPIGPPGPQGVQGGAGAQGPSGTGTAGPAGSAGPAGPQGNPGTPGPPGPECPPGYTPTDQPAPLPATGTWRVCVQNP